MDKKGEKRGKAERPEGEGGAVLPVGGPYAPRANREYKDTVFRDLFGSPARKEYALELYNALAGTDYDDPDALELNTIDNVISMGMRDDVSFLVGDEVVLWEHQSTPNANMPVRGLLYIAEVYRRLLNALGDRVYRTKLIELPTPRFVVFYNGGAERPDRYEMRLSDAFSGDDPAVEVVATVVNVNEGRNPDLASACRALAGYSFLVARVRDGRGSGLPLRDAILRAIDESVGMGYLVDYLTERRAEVADMFMTEWDEQAYVENERRDSYEQGKQDGLEQGVQQGMARLAEAMRAEGASDSVIEAAMRRLEAAGVAAGRAE